MASIVVVLGMHRSGTSFLIHALQAAGMYLGPDLMNEPYATNLEGHGEAWESVRINDRILSLSGGTWYRPPDSLRGDAEITAQMTAFLHKLAVQPIAGWKDPRTTITFPLWKPHLHQYHVVACIRHPLSVARSLHVRDGFDLDFGLSLWAAYNERLLQAVQAEDQEIHWVDFDLSGERLQATVQSLCERLELPNRHAPEVFNPFLRHQSVVPDSVLDPRFQQLYDRLRAQARASGPSAQPAADLERASLPALLAEWQAERKHLLHVQRGHNTVIQRLERSLFEAQNEITRLQGDWQTRPSGTETGAARQHVNAAQGLVAALQQKVHGQYEETCSRFAEITLEMARLHGTIADLRAKLNRSPGRLLVSLFAACWHKLQHWTSPPQTTASGKDVCPFPKGRSATQSQRAAVGPPNKPGF